MTVCVLEMPGTPDLGWEIFKEPKFYQVRQHRASLRWRIRIILSVRTKNKVETGEMAQWYAHWPLLQRTLV